MTSLRKLMMRCAFAATAATVILPVMSAFAARDRTNDETPSVMLLIDEKNLGTIPTAEVEAMGVHLLLQEGMQVVDQEMVRANLKKDQQLLKMAGDARGAAALGLQFGADIVFVGDAVAKPSARRLAGSNLRTYQAVLTLKAISTDNANMLASASEVASVIALEDVEGGSKALKAAGQKVFPGLIERTIESWDEVNGIHIGTKTFEITIGGVDATWKVRNIRKALESREDLLEKVEQVSYTPGSAIFEVASLVSAKDLAEELVLKPPRKLQFQVLNVTARKINLRAVKK